VGFLSWDGRFGLAIVGVAAVLAVATTALVMASTSERQEAATAPTADAEANEVARALERLSRDPGALVAAGATAHVGGRASQAIPDGSTVSPDVDSWAPDGLGGGSMVVTIAPAGGPATTYVAVMVREGGGWKVLATFRIATPTGAGGS